MNRSKLAALILGGLALLWALALFVGIPFLYGRKVEALVGQNRATVESQIGPPSREWAPSTFSCDPRFPCVKENARGGPVLLYTDGSQGWYLYFDSTGKLALTEVVRPRADGGTAPAR